jgi:hypothetical protein
MSDAGNLTIHVVVFHDGEWWIAQCLEYDLCTAKERLEDLSAEIRRFLKVQILGSLDLKIEPFSGLGPAPKRFWRMYEQAVALSEEPPTVEMPHHVAIEARIAA